MKPLLALILCFLLAGCADRESPKLNALEVQVRGLETQIGNLKAQTDRLVEIASRPERPEGRASQGDRFKMTSGKVGDIDIVFLYDAQTGSVWRYYRNWSADRKEVTDEGFVRMISLPKP